MNKNKALAIALSAGLVLGGAYVTDNNIAYAEEPAVNAELEAKKAEATGAINALNLSEVQKNTFLAKVNAATDEKSVDAAVTEAKNFEQYLITKMMNMPAVDGVDPNEVKARLDASTTMDEVLKIANEIQEKADAGNVDPEAELEAAKVSAIEAINKLDLSQTQKDAFIAKVNAAKTK